MKTFLFKQYQKPEEKDLLSLAKEKDLLTFAEVSERIAYLTRSLGRNEIIFQREIQDEIDSEIQNEIDFYKMQIWCFERGDERDWGDERGKELDRDALTIPSLSDSYISSDEDEEDDSLEQKINRVEDVVYQLVGGLFNQKTQSNMIESHLCSLNGTKYTGNHVDEDTIWPTTRQGDQHEEEIKLLKHQVSKLEDTVALLVRLIREK